MSSTDWRLGLPVLDGIRLTLREPVLADAPALFRELCVPEVCVYVPPPPPAVDGVERMIAKGIERRCAGQAFNFGIQPAGVDELAGIIQFVSSRDHSDTAISDVWELGFALGSRFWGRGMFGEAAGLALDFAFNRVRLAALEAWVIAGNQRANRALEKLGGSPAHRPDTTSPDGRTDDFVLWTLRNPRT